MTRSKIVKKLDRVFSLYIRNRHSKNGKAECFTCGKIDEVSRLHAGHFMSRRHLATRWDEKNVNAQCAGCNTFRGGEQYRQSIGIDRKWGEGTSADLEQRAQTIVKLSRVDYEEAIENIKRKIEELN